MCERELPPRIPANAGFCDPSKLPKGPRGFNLCRFCSKECPSSRRTFCSEECVDEWKCRTDPSHQARKIKERDRGICQRCGLDVDTLQDYALKLQARLRAQVSNVYRYPERRRLSDARIAVLKERLEFCVERLGTRDIGARRLWDVDHIIAVAEGGGSCGLENLRLLCKVCHRIVTRELRARLKAAKLARQ